jgi:membrane protein
MAAAAHPRGGVVARVRDLHPRKTARALLRSFDEHDLLTYASAIAFQAIFAVIPLALAGLGLFGLLSLDEVWTKHIGPALRSDVSHPVYVVFDSTVHRILTSKRVFWATAGALLAVWEVSGAMRATMTVLDRVYRVRRERSRRERYAVSTVLSALVTALILAGAAAFELAGPAARAVFGPGGGADVATQLRWPACAAFLFAAVAAVVRWGPAQQRPWHWVSFGTSLTVLAWLLMSAVFGWYLRSVADYGSMFGNLATVIVAFEYAYASAIVLVAGLALDGIAQNR